ncbi:MAG: thioredoxin domain-containing protein [Flavobacteriaceae bacterium]|nr:thioredoxin domain-containing protein [Flavobacteriaceae bacterium]
MNIKSIFLFVFFSLWCNAQSEKNTLEKIEERRNIENKPVVVLFSTDWCGICRIQKRNLKKLPKEFWDKIYFISINPEKYTKDITFLGKKYSFVSNGATGLHSIAYEWAGNRVPAYPFWTFIDVDDQIATYQGVLKIEELQRIFEK